MSLKSALTGSTDVTNSKQETKIGSQTTQSKQSANASAQAPQTPTQTIKHQKQKTNHQPPTKPTQKAPNQTQPAREQSNQPNTQETQVDPENLAQKLPQAIQEELIVDWVAAARPYRKRSKQFFTTMWAIALLVAIILIFANQFIFAMVVVALAFMAHVFFKIPPGNIYYALTTFGVRIGEELYLWEELNHYWFDQKYGQKILMIDTIRFPHRLTLVIFPEDEMILRKLLSTVLPEFRPKPTLYEKWAAWLTKTFPLEEEKIEEKPQKTQPPRTKSKQQKS